MTVRFSIGDRVEWGDHTFAPAGRGEIEVVVGPTDHHPPHVIVRVEDTLVRESVYVSELRPADLTNDAPRGECRECGHEYGLHYGFCTQQNEYKVNVCPDAPRRRTEPAITVPTDEALERFYEQMYASLGNTIMGYGLPKYVLYPPPVEAFTPTEVEACKSHGSAAYACMAADCDQVRELLAVEEAKAEMEAWRLSNGEWLEWHTDSDSAGTVVEEYVRDVVEDWAQWLVGLTPPVEGEAVGDWWSRQEPGPQDGRQTRAYMQHLYDKLAADPRALDASGRTEEP